MRLHIRTLRKIIRESISESHRNKLWELFASGPEGYNQAWDLWDTLDPGGCPLPENPDEWFGDNGQPYIIEMFSETTMSLEDPHFFNDFCHGEWVETEEEKKEDLVFEFGFPFVCGDEDAEYDFGMGDRFFVVPGTDPEQIKAYIITEFEAELAYFAGTGDRSWWANPVSIIAQTSGEDQIKELENGHGYILVSYGKKL